MRRAPALLLPLLLLLPPLAHAAPPREAALARELDRSLTELDETAESRTCGIAGGAIVGGGLLAGGIYLGTDHPFWSVLLGSVGAAGLLGTTLEVAFPGPIPDCSRGYRKLREDDPARLDAGKACLADAASHSRAKRLAEGGIELAIGGAVIGLWAWQEPWKGETSVLIIGIINAVFALAAFGDTRAEDLLEDYEAFEEGGLFVVPPPGQQAGLGSGLGYALSLRF